MPENKSETTIQIPKQLLQSILELIVILRSRGVSSITIPQLIRDMNIPNLDNQDGKDIIRAVLDGMGVSLDNNNPDVIKIFNSSADLDLSAPDAKERVERRARQQLKKRMK